MEQIESHGQQPAGDGDRERHPATTQRQAGRSRAPRTPDPREGDHQRTPVAPAEPALLPEPRPQTDASPAAGRPDEVARDSFWKFG